MPYPPYPPNVAEFIETPSDGDRDALARQLEELTPESLVTQRPFDARAAEACLAGLWLRHGFLDESHQISQQLDTPEGSWWHAIMHREEGDLGNSKYWLRQAGFHPVHTTLTEKMVQLGAGSRSLQDANGDWSPAKLVDLAGVAGRDADATKLYRAASELEWQELFAWCWKQAHSGV